MKKLLCMAFAVLAMTLLLAGCGGGGMPEGENVITIGIAKNAQVSDYDNNALTKWLAEETGMDIRIVEFHGTKQDIKTQIAAMVASGERMPDIITGIEFGDDLRLSYGQQGIFIDMKPYYDDKELSKNFWEPFYELPIETQNWFYHKVEDPESGEWIGIPNIPDSNWDVLTYQPWINQPWLDKLNLKVPTNTEELIDVLTHFRDDDPNGNGQKDEIPCLGNTSFVGDTVSWLLNMKMFADDETYIHVDENGKVYSPFVTDEYRKCLQWINQLMAEGLVSPLSVTTKGATLEQNLAAGDFIGIVLGHPTSLMPNSVDFEKWTPVPIWGNMIYGYNNASYTTFITESCKNPKKAWEVCMVMCSTEFSVRTRYGDKGVHWDWADEGAVGMTGEPALIKLYSDVYAEAQTDATWRYGGAGCVFIRSMEDVQVAEVDTPTYRQDVKILKFLDDAWAAVEKNNPKNRVPRLMWTPELKKESPYRADVTSLMSTYQAKFVTGQLDPFSDSDWQKYLDELKDATYDKWIQTVQKVVDHMIEIGMYKPQ